ncbi:MAG: universal stress protein [Hyphomonadaceae bacterium]|nr:universal stress protein [Hyphomonadaceae bacterium]
MTGRIQLILPAGQQPKPIPAIEAAVALTHTCGAALTASVAQNRANVPAHWLAREYAHLPVAEFNADMAADAIALRESVTRAAEGANVSVRLIEILNGLGDGERAVVMAARTHDFSVLGLPDFDASARQLAEQLLFDSGRPLLILPLSRPFSLNLGTIAVAWDHSEPASRVLSAALPLLKRAKRIVVFSVLGAKKLPRAEAAQDAAEYLMSHGIEATWEMLDSDDRARGRFIMETAIARGAGLLVMGAYATLPAQEYLLGGVTVSVLNEPLLPVLMSN